MNSALPHNLPLDLADAGRAAAGPGTVPLELVRLTAFGRGSRNRKKWARFRDRVADRVTRDGNGIDRLPDDTVLDCGHNAGRTVAEVVQQRPAPVPVEVKSGTERVRQRWSVEETIRTWLADFRGKNPRLGVSTPAFAAAFERVYGPELARLRAQSGSKLRLGKAALRRIMKGKPTHWGESGQHAQELFDAELFDEAIGLYCHPNDFSVRGAYGIYTYCKAKAQKEGKVWRGQRTAFAERLTAAVPEPFRKLGQGGEWKFERDAMPKLARPRGRFACGEAASCDGRDVDALLRVPTSAGGWRPIRPTEVVFFDVESGYPLGWHIAAHETADATLLALRHMHDRVGLPTYIETDNGKGFCAAFGSRRRKYPDWEARKLHALCEHLRIAVDHKVPRHAWKKSAESRFSGVKEIDRLHGHFIGGSPDERPEDVLRRVKKDIMELPTLDEWRQLRVQDYELFADTPSPALGGLTRRQYFDAHRGEIRKADPEFLEFASSRLVGKRTVRAQGVEWKGILYGHGDEEVFKLQGRQVHLRIDPADLSAIWLCDQRGAPLCIATRSDLANATPEHLREAERRRGHLRKIAREFNAEHSFFRGTAVQQVRHVLAEHRAAEAAEVRRQQAAPEPVPVRVIGSEHVPAVRKARAVARRQETRRVLQAGVGAESVPGSEPVRTGLELLAARGREQPQPEVEAECPADRLRRFSHAG